MRCYSAADCWLVQVQTRIEKLAALDPSMGGNVCASAVGQNRSKIDNLRAKAAEKEQQAATKEDGGLFRSSQQGSGGGMFGASVAPAGGGMFGAAVAPAGGGLFGPAAADNRCMRATLQPQACQSDGYMELSDFTDEDTDYEQRESRSAQAPAGGGLFGAAAAPAGGGLFGAAASGDNSGGLFGGAANGGGLFGGVASGATYSHTWHSTGKLGIVVQSIGQEKSDLAGVRVKSVSAPNLISIIKVKSKLVQVAGQQVGAMSYDQVVGIVKQASRPLTIVFELPGGSPAWQWACAVCTLDNDREVTVCAACNTRRGGATYITQVSLSALQS